MNILSREAAIALAVCIAAVLVPVLVFSFVSFPLKLNRDEKELLNFSPIKISLQARNWKELNAVCPVTADSRHQTGQSATEKGVLQKLVAVAEPDPQLTFILYSNSSRDIAILDGRLLHQGQRLKEIRLVRIEQKRVQIEDRKGKRWLTME